MQLHSPLAVERGIGVCRHQVVHRFRLERLEAISTNAMVK